MPRINYTRPFIYEYQKAILNSQARYTVTEAATKVGKTASHIIWLFEQALILKENQRVWWVAPTIGQAKIAFDRMKVQITDKRIYKANESLRTITLVNGGIIEFKTAEKPDNLYGDDVFAIVFDEFTRAREAAWHALRSTLTATGGKCKFIGNVKGKKNWGYRLGQKAKSGEPGYEYFKITAYDAAAEGMMTKDGRSLLQEIEEAKRDLPESVFNELYLAEASEDGSNPFGISFINQCTYPISALPPVCFGIDLAKSSDYTVIIGLDKNRSVCYFERFQMDWRQTIRKIKDLPNVPMAIDSTGVGDPIAEDVARTHQVEMFKFSSSSKQQIMEGLAVKIQAREINFPEGHIKDELENFEFEYTRTGVKYSAPEGLHDDCVCGLALANHIWRKTGTGTYSFA
jgi:phage FluMu gp28-like protein